MDMARTLILVSNPGSASRKYALFDDNKLRAELHFEFVYQKLVCTLAQNKQHRVLHLDFHTMSTAASHVIELFQANGVIAEDEHVKSIGLRIVAPGSFFLQDHVIDDAFINYLEAIRPHAPIHIAAALEEYYALRKQFNDVTIVGVSDSAFHATKPDYAWNYGISLEVADHYEIKRFGYHGLSISSVIRELHAAKKLTPKLVVCHLGSGASVTAVHSGKSMDNTMGYSPLEGVIMSTRSGNIDPTAIPVLKDVSHFDEAALEDYLNNHSGLLGLGGSSDIRELLRREMDGDNRSRLALATYVYSIQKAIGQMTATLGGIDALVFTGTVGERSSVMRERIVAPFHYLDLIIDKRANHACDSPEELAIISRLAHSKPIFVASAQEAAEIARHTSTLADQ